MQTIQKHKTAVGDPLALTTANYWIFKTKLTNDLRTTNSNGLGKVTGGGGGQNKQKRLFEKYSNLIEK